MNNTHNYKILALAQDCYAKLGEAQRKWNDIVTHIGAGANDVNAKILSAMNGCTEIALARGNDIEKYEKRFQIDGVIQVELSIEGTKPFKIAVCKPSAKVHDISIPQSFWDSLRKRYEGKTIRVSGDCDIAVVNRKGEIVDFVKSCCP